MTETATLTGRELDRVVAEAMGWTGIAQHHYGLYGWNPKLTMHRVPLYSTSLGDCEEILKYLDGCETMEDRKPITWNLYSWWEYEEDYPSTFLYFIFEIVSVSDDVIGKWVSRQPKAEVLSRAFLEAAPKLRRKTG